MELVNGIKGIQIARWIWTTDLQVMGPVSTPAFEGLVSTSNELIFTGRDVKENKEFLIKILLKDITDLYYGFDDVFRGRDKRAWPWNKPLKIRYKY